VEEGLGLWGLWSCVLTSEGEGGWIEVKVGIYVVVVGPVVRRRMACCGWMGGVRSALWGEAL